jgi:predicted mannosyl-3-phosphoglycerate phosphatase (HAD superfamily)
LELEEDEEDSTLLEKMDLAFRVEAYALDLSQAFTRLLDHLNKSSADSTTTFNSSQVPGKRAMATASEFRIGRRS